MAIRVTVWNEFTHEKNDPEARAQYPDGIHVTIRDFLSVDSGLTIRTATLDEPACGLPDEVLFDTDVLVWWGHMRHADAHETDPADPAEPDDAKPESAQPEQTPPPEIFYDLAKLPEPVRRMHGLIVEEYVRAESG
mgnify:CR=1 FL=1